MRTLLVVLLSLAAVSATAGTVYVPTPNCSALFESDPLGERLTDPGFSQIASPGDPALPFTELCIALPPDAVASSVRADLVNASTAEVPGTHSIAPAPPLVTVVDGTEVVDWGVGKQIVDGRNTLVYESDDFYPAASLEIAEKGKMRSWQLVRLRFYPYRYNPVTGQLTFTSGGQIAISYSTAGTHIATVTAAQAASDSAFAGKFPRLVANLDQARAWYAGKKTSGTLAVTAATPAASYVIITTSAIVAGSTKLQSFVNFKATRGFTVRVATEAQWGGGTGDVAANRIRSYLASRYLADGIHYVLFIGGPDPATGTVPMKMLWPRKNLGTYPEAPSDYFYADLTGNWDRDGDGYYGEYDNDFGSGGVDRFPEVIVGRIPYYGSFADLDAILQKTIDYESGVIGGSWVRNVLLTAKPSDASTPGYHMCEAIKSAAVEPAGFTTTRVYEQTYGLNPPPDYTPCNYDNVTAGWNRHAGFHFWWTHGNQTIAADIIDSSRTQYLDANYPSFTFQVSCLNAYPENSSNLGYALLKRGAIVTDSATRVSWYYPGQTAFAGSDSNAGMAYQYAINLIKEHKPCGDAHFEMMTELPNGIWMNHCVFNLYGDPSLAYSSSPSVKHTSLGDTDYTTGTYVVDADITSNANLSSVTLKWNTDGSSTFNNATMTLVSGSIYRGQIPAQPMGTTVYYYVRALDLAGLVGTSPGDAPATLHSFHVRADTGPPSIQHTPFADTGDQTGPYLIRATVTDDIGITSVQVYYRRNGGTETALTAAAVGGGVYEAAIPGPSSAGDVISYYIVATDASVYRKTTRSPAAPNVYSFGVANKVAVAVYNCATTPSYFTGSNTNIYSQVVDTLNTDPSQRILATAVTSLTSADLTGKSVLVLPDNVVLPADLAAVSNWFVPGKVIVAIDSGACYGAYSGWMWPAAAGTNGYMYSWDTDSDFTQQIWLSDPVTAGYSVGQVIDARMYETEFLVNRLPSDAKALAGKQSDANKCYAAYRDVPGRGRFVVLGPYASLMQTQYSILRNSVMLPAASRGLHVLAPAGGASYTVGQTVTVSFETTGGWTSSDRIKLEYCTGLDSTWRQIAGAESLVYTSHNFNWNTTGLPGSRGYKVRATLIGSSTFDETDQTFSIIPNLSIAEAKARPDGQVVKLLSKVVTCSVGSLYYIQEPGAPTGIRLCGSLQLTRGSSVDVTGGMSTVGGERVVNVDTVQPIEVQGPAPSGQSVGPYAARTSSLGGGAFGLQQAVMEYRRVGSTLQFLPAFGINNVGMLVRVCGKVTYVGSDHFYVDDGAGCNDGSGHAGVRVISGTFTRPSLNQKVSATGISGVYFSQGNPLRALILPSQADWRIIQ